MTLRVLSYNILCGGEDRLPRIATVIRQQRPDVVALLEANSRANAQMLELHTSSVGESTDIVSEPEGKSGRARRERR